MGMPCGNILIHWPLLFQSTTTNIGRYFFIQLVNSYLVLQYFIQSLIYREMLLLHLFYLFQIHECWGSRGGLILELKSCMKFDYSMLKKTFFLIHQQQSKFMNVSFILQYHYATVFPPPNKKWNFLHNTENQVLNL